jgi:hypothetical protein
MALTGCGEPTYIVNDSKDYLVMKHKANIVCKAEINDLEQAIKDGKEQSSAFYPSVLKAKELYEVANNNYTNVKSLNDFKESERARLTKAIEDINKPYLEEIARLNKTMKIHDTDPDYAYSNIPSRSSLQYHIDKQNEEMNGGYEGSLSQIKYLLKNLKPLEDVTALKAILDKVEVAYTKVSTQYSEVVVAVANGKVIDAQSSVSVCHEKYLTDNNIQIVGSDTDE